MPKLSEITGQPRTLKLSQVLGPPPAKTLAERYAAQGIDPNEGLDPTEGQPWQVNAAAGFGKAGMDTVRGVQQLFGQRSQQQIEEDRRLDAPLMADGAGLAGNIVGQTAQIAVPVPAGAALKATSWAGRAAPYVGAAARGGAFGGAQGVGEGETRAGNAGTSAALGAAGQAGAAVIGKVASKAQRVIEPEVQKALDTLKRLNIPTHLAQTMDSGFLKLVSSVANKLPFSGVRQAGRNQQAAFNREMGKTMGMDGLTSINDDVLAAAARKQSNGYDTLFGRNSVLVDTTTVAELRRIAQQAADDLTPDKAKIVANQIGKFIGKVDDDSTIPGRAYQNIRQGMRAIEKHPEHGHLVRQVRKTMEDAANRSFKGNDAKALKELNQQFANRKVIEASLKQVAGAGGDVRPASLWPLVNQKFGGTKEMRDLARAGQLVLKDGVPDSGTSQREMVNRLLGLGSGAGAATFFGVLPMALKAAGVGLAAGRLLNTPAAARVIPGSGGKTLNGLARLARGLPAAVPATVNAKKQQRAKPPVR